MTVLQAIILGIVQGLTEFLPISSSAHLALVPYWFNWQLDEEVVFLFGVLVQMGTLGAVLVYYFPDLKRIFVAVFTNLFKGKPFEDPDAWLGWMVVLGTVPAGVIGLLLKDIVESAFNSPRMISICLLGTAALLAAADRVRDNRRKIGEISTLDALAIGFGQALAIFPGISRSGATITAAVFKKFDRSDAGRFSFLLSIPIMIAAGVLSLADIRDTTLLRTVAPQLIVATLFAAVVGFLAIRWFISFIAKKPFRIFTIYCAIVGFATLVMTFIR